MPKKIYQTQPKSLRIKVVNSTTQTNTVQNNFSKRPFILNDSGASSQDARIYKALRSIYKGKGTTTYSLSTIADFDILDDLIEQFIPTPLPSRVMKQEKQQAKISLGKIEAKRRKKKEQIQRRAEKIWDPEA